jgi:hypothetical protein
MGSGSPQPRAVVCRLACSLAIAAALGAALVQAQIPGRNVNMVSGRTWPDGDPFLQRQNEPSVAASTRNPLHLLAGSNDYRTVDLPGLPGVEETGDAWLGLYKSLDGGQRWVSTLLPGYPQDPHRSQSALRDYGTAADPVVRAGTNGLLYYSGLAFNREDNGASAVFVARYIDNNNREGADPIAYLGTNIAASDPGTTGRFLDKPWMAVDIPRGNAPTCRIVTPAADPTKPAIVQNVPAGPVYVAYTSFTGEGATLRSDIMFTYSADCGVRWSTPVRLNPNDGSLNQGATIAIEPNTGIVSVAWRRFTRAGAPDTDAIMVTQSATFGRRFLNAIAVRRLLQSHGLARIVDRLMEHRRMRKPVKVEALSEFDQGTSADDLSFRTNAYPAMAWDDRGRLYVAWTERGFSTLRPGAADGDAKIVMATSLAGVIWGPPRAVSERDTPGHQFMPSMTFAGGKLMLVYYDLREDVAGFSSKFIDDKTAAVVGKRHTMDIRASMAAPGFAPVFAPSVRVSDYFVGRRPVGVPPSPKLVPCVLNPLETCEQLQFNPPNLPMFKLGTVPFIGDYIDIAPAPAFVPIGRGRWAYNTSRESVPVFHAVWSDNRDVRPPPNDDWKTYTPPDYCLNPTDPTDPQCILGGRASIYDPTKQVTACDGSNSAFTASRNQNIYTARIAGGLLVGSPGNAKPLSATLQRGFAVFAQNMTATTRHFRMRILNQPPGGRASFAQFPLPPYTSASPGPLAFLDVTTPPKSTATRTVFVTSSDPHAQINIEIVEIGASGPVPGGLSGTTILNADIENPPIENADIENADIENQEHTNADIENPAVRSADIENADIENADIENADIENADIENADIENADIENADIENADIENSSLTDVTWNVTNTGNTTAGFNVNLFLSQAAPAGVKLQLVLHKSYTTPAAVSCDLKLRSHTVLVTNILNPVFITPGSGGLPDPNSPAATNATIQLAPGEVGKITLRLLDLDLTNNVTIVNDRGDTISIDPAFVPGVTLSPLVRAQEIGTVALADGVTEPPIITPDDANSTIFFIQQPSDTVVGELMAPARVQVRDRSGAVIPGVPVTLALSAAPDGGGMQGPTTALTDAAGIAQFDGLRFTVPGGYRMQASVSVQGLVIPPAQSALFSILPIVVSNANDAGPGSLRQAIVNANNNAGVVDIVTFGVQATIALLSPLPAIVEPATFNGLKTGACGQSGPAVEIYGGNIATGSDSGLLVTGGNTTIRGLSITGFRGNGIELRSGGGNRVECSYVGVAPDGVTARGNGVNGIQIVDSAANVVGGPSPIVRNVISGNTGEGVKIDGAAATGNVIEGNFVGTNAAGSAALGNAASGIYIRRAPGNSIVGNVVSGNNGFAGIAICGSADFCGGANDGTPGNNASGNIVNGNRVGTDAAGLAPLGNAGVGVNIENAPMTTVGGTGAGNVITSNAVGVAVVGPQSADSRILQNSIHANAGLGIDVGGGGVTPNDTGDADGLQNFPVLTSVSTDGGTTTVRGTLHSQANTEFLLEFFTNASCDPSGNGEGQTWFATVSAVSTDGQGNLAFTSGVSPALPVGTIVTATATGPSGTSEFSACAEVEMFLPSEGEPPDPPVLIGAVSNRNLGQAYVPLSFNAPAGSYMLRFYATPTCPVVGEPGTLLFTQPVTVTTGSLAATVLGDRFVEPGTLVVATAENADGDSSTFSNCATVAATNAVLWSASAGGNDHFYEYVNTPTPSWSTANTAANGRSLLGLKGHLVSITSAGENEVVRNIYLGMGLDDMRAWIGLTDPAGAFAWSWVTGEDFAYSNWSAGEPTGNGERWVEFFAAGAWNDNVETGFDNQGYAVEYEPEFLAGRLTDTAGDATSDPRINLSPDLVSATVTRVGDELRFRIRFAPGTFDAATTNASLLLDTDRNPATGSPGVDASCSNDSAIFGMDYQIDAGKPPTGQIYRFTGCGDFTFGSTASVVVATNGFDITFPLSAIGSEGGLLNFKVITQSQVDGGSTGILDYMSDIGSAPGTTGGQ